MLYERMFASIFFLFEELASAMIHRFVAVAWFGDSINIHLTF